MGLYRARDLFRVPGLLSLCRLPLAALFPAVLDRPWWALAILVAAGVSDVLDGWYARRFGEVTPTGAAVDPITDKIFVITVAVSLVASGRLRPSDVLLLCTREIAELPLVGWLAASTRARRWRAARATANLPGKLATACQFVATAAALLRLPHLPWLIATTAIVGVFSGAIYWLRTLRDARIDPGLV